MLYLVGEQKWKDETKTAMEVGMSGGFFEYNQFNIGYIVDELDKLISMNASTEKDEYGDKKGKHYPAEIIELFKEAALTLRKARIMTHRIDWLVSGDDGEESFIERWKEDLSKI